MEATNQGNSFIQSLGAHPLTKKPKDAGNEIASAHVLNTLKRSNKTCYIFVPRAAIPLVNYRRRWPNASQVWRPVVFAINLTNFVCGLFSPGRCFLSSPHSTHHRGVQEKIPRLNLQARTCLEHLSFFCNAEETAGEFKWWNLNGGRTNLVEPVEPSSAQSKCHNRNVIWRCPHRNISVQVTKELIFTSCCFQDQKIKFLVRDRKMVLQLSIVKND